MHDRDTYDAQCHGIVRHCQSDRSHPAFYTLTDTEPAMQRIVEKKHGRIKPCSGLVGIKDCSKSCSSAEPILRLPTVSKRTGVHSEPFLTVLPKDMP